MIIADAPDEMTMVDVIAGWEPDDRTLLYDPKFCFPPETLLALARAHACCPDLVYHERRRHKDSDAFAYVFGLGAVGVIDSSGGCATTAAESSGTKVDYSELDQEPAAYAAVEPEEPEYVLVSTGTADEVERERRREANAEATFVDAWNNQVRSIEQLLEEIDEETARTATSKSLVVRGTDDFFDGFLEEEAAIEVGWNILVSIDDEAAVPEWA